MNGSLLDYIFKCWADFYYTNPLVILCQLITLIIVLKSKKKNRSKTLFIAYLFASLLLFVACDVIHYLHGKKDAFYEFILEFFNMLFLVVEFLAFSHFFDTVLKLKRKKELFIISNFTFFLLVVIYLFIALSEKYTDHQIRNYAVKFFFLELVYFGVLSLYYLYDLFKNMNSENLLANPAFWITSCSLFYFFAMPISLFLTETLRGENTEMFKISVSFHYLSLCFAYIGISKAFLCKDPKVN